MKKDADRKIKICFTASSGGHLEELSQLKELVNAENDFVLTEKGPYSELDWCSSVYKVKQINRREILFIPKFIMLFAISFRLLMREKPDIIISTGALATYPISLLGKLLGKKIIYIESFARVDQASLTGKLMYKISDLFIVQWKEMLDIYPKAVYGGAIF